MTSLKTDDREPAEIELEELFRAASSTSQATDPAKAKAKLRIKELKHNWNIANTITGGMKDSVARFNRAQEDAQLAADRLAQKHLTIAKRQFWAAAFAAVAAALAAIATAGILTLEALRYWNGL